MSAPRTSWLRKLFGRTPKRPRPAPPAPRARLALTALEAREVPSVSSAVLVGGVLTVTGTGGSDVIRVVQTTDNASAGAIRVDGATITLNGQARASVPDTLVTQVVERGGGGNDALSFVRATPAAGLPVNQNITAVLDGGSDANSYPGAAPQDVIIDTTLTGGREMVKAIMDRWQATGGAGGPLGSPKTDDAAATSSGGRVNQFQGGNIYWSPQTGAHALTGAILRKALRVDGGLNLLGLPATEPSTYGPTTSVEFQRLDIASRSGVYDVLSYGTFVVSDTFFEKYRAAGGPQGALGGPRTDLQVVRNTTFHATYLQQAFSQGGLYLVPGAGNPVRLVSGAIDAKYRALGGAGGFLGAPTADTRSAGGGKAWSDFQGGIITSGLFTQAHVVYGAIVDKYRSFGGPTGLLGIAISDEEDVPGQPGARVSYFAGGSIYWSNPTGACVVLGGSDRGGIGRFLRYGTGDRGSALVPLNALGLPTSDSIISGVGYYNHFQRGDVYYSAATGAHMLQGPILRAFNDLGGLATFGYPTSDEYTTRDGRRAVRFSEGYAILVRYYPGGYAVSTARL